MTTLDNEITAWMREVAALPDPKINKQPYANHLYVLVKRAGAIVEKLHKEATSAAIREATREETISGLRWQLKEANALAARNDQFTTLAEQRTTAAIVKLTEAMEMLAQADCAVERCSSRNPCRWHARYEAWFKEQQR